MARRRGGGKTTCEASYGLDINWLYRRHYLHPGSISGVRWGSTRHPSAGVTCRCLGLDMLVLSYSRNGQSVNLNIRLIWSQCRYGGTRPWFECPNCQERKGKLYYAGGTYACRTCCNLCYASQLEPRMRRGEGLARKLAQRLGGRFGEGDIPKPKGMHWKTYARIGTRMEAANNLSIANILWWARRW